MIDEKKVLNIILERKNKIIKKHENIIDFHLRGKLNAIISELNIIEEEIRNLINSTMMKKFSELKIGEHFRFAKLNYPKGKFFETYTLVGIKKTENSYRMGGLNRIIDSKNFLVIPTTEELN